MERFAQSWNGRLGPVGPARRSAFTYRLKDLDQGAITRDGGHLFKNADLRAEVPSPQVRGSVTVTVTDERYEIGVDLSRVSCICFRSGLKYPRNLATRGDDNAIEYAVQDGEATHARSIDQKAMERCGGVNRSLPISLALSLYLKMRNKSGNVRCAPSGHKSHESRDLDLGNCLMHVNARNLLELEVPTQVLRSTLFGRDHDPSTGPRSPGDLNKRLRL
jgi:hypothetical protein